MIMEIVFLTLPPSLKNQDALILENSEQERKENYLLENRRHLSNVIAKVNKRKDDL